MQWENAAWQVIQSLPYDGKADVFSWAILFAELLAAKPPYADLYLTPLQVPPCLLPPNIFITTATLATATATATTAILHATDTQILFAYRWECQWA